MPRLPRLEFPGAVYHVTARGNERRSIFRDDRESGGVSLDLLTSTAVTGGATAPPPA